jgi:hypothetical protein
MMRISAMRFSRQQTTSMTFASLQLRTTDVENIVAAKIIIQGTRDSTCIAAVATVFFQNRIFCDVHHNSQVAIAGLFSAVKQYTSRP